MATDPAPISAASFICPPYLSNPWRRRTPIKAPAPQNSSRRPLLLHRSQDPDLQIISSLLGPTSRCVPPFNPEPRHSSFSQAPTSTDLGLSPLPGLLPRDLDPASHHHRLLLLIVRPPAALPGDRAIPGVPYPPSCVEARSTTAGGGAATCRCHRSCLNQTNAVAAIQQLSRSPSLSYRPAKSPEPETQPKLSPSSNGLRPEIC